VLNNLPAHSGASNRRTAARKIGVSAGNRGKGRKKGVPNKTTALLKDAILIAAIKAGGGGEEGLVAYLETQARENPGPFLTLLGKILPLQVSGDGDPIKITFSGVDAGLL
jgi:hypothetical protein